MSEFIRSITELPRAAGAPTGRRWWDWALLAFVAVNAVLEGVFRDDLVWRPFAVTLGVVIAFMVLWRRSHPLVVVVLGFGAQAISDIASIVNGTDSTVLDASVLAGTIVVYALTRWGSGTEMIVGAIVVLVTHVITDAADPEFNIPTSLLGSAQWLVPAGVGLVFRYRSNATERAFADARTRERERIARELHDTVAHYVSGIAVQAQAGRALAASDPKAALETLPVIEAAASQTLAEMRAMVGALRAEKESGTSPRRRLADIASLDGTTTDGLRIEVTLAGKLDDLSEAIESALYRTAQESITNARRHARHATRVVIAVSGRDDDVHLRVDDDGEMTSTSQGSGFGLVGMRERAELLGGELSAGPGPDRGWRVDVVIPRVSAS